MSDFSHYKCTVCGTTGNWRNVDEFHFKKTGMHMCTGCGFITYPELCSKQKDIKEFYKHDYRDAPTVNHLFSGERKLHYHGDFLSDPVFAQWKTDNIDSPTILEIGAALGMVLKWFQSLYPKAQLFGTELTQTFVRNAWHLFKINLTEEPDFSRKYDLIVSYKVAEHIPGVEKELRKYAEALTEKGFLYISVPVWFGELSDPGRNGLDLEFYYDTNHVNVWSENLFRILLKRSGLKIIKENTVIYGATFLCQRDDSLMTEMHEYDKPEQRLEQLKSIFESTKCALEGKYEEAIALWPEFPDANINAYEVARSKIHHEGFPALEEKFITRAIKNCPKSAQVRNFAGDVCLRYEQFQKAVDHFEAVLKMRPHEPMALMGLGHTFRQMAEKNAQLGEHATAAKYFSEAKAIMEHLQKVSQQCRNDAKTWQMQDNSRVPTPFEKPAINKSDFDNGPKSST